MSITKSLLQQLFSKCVSNQQFIVTLMFTQLFPKPNISCVTKEFLVYGLQSFTEHRRVKMKESSKSALEKTPPCAPAESLNAEI